MPRHFPSEIFIGQKVFVHVNPTTHAIEALVTYLDRAKGLVHVKPLGSAVKWAARPRAIVNMAGEYLHFENNRFFYDRTPGF